MDSNPPLFISPYFNTSLFQNDGETLSFEEADKRYLRINGGFVNGFTNFLNGIQTGNINLTSINGTPYESFNGNLDKVLNITTSLGPMINTYSGSSHFQIYQESNSTAFLGTVSTHDLTLMTNNTNRWIINRDNGDLSSSNSSIIMGSSSNLRIGTNTLTGTDIFRLTNITTGTASASKALVINSDRSISNINTIGAQVVNCLTNTVTPTIRVGNTNSLNNCFEISYNNVALSSSNNSIDIKAFGSSNNLRLFANGELNMSTSSSTLSITTNQIFMASSTATLRLGVGVDTNDSFNIRFNPVSFGNISNNLSIQAQNGNGRFNILANGRVGINMNDVSQINQELVVNGNVDLRGSVPQYRVNGVALDDMYVFKTGSTVSGPLTMFQDNNSGTFRTLMNWGSAIVGTHNWSLKYYRGSVPQNSSIDINNNQNSHGISIGNFDSASGSGGAVCVFNGVNGVGFINAGWGGVSGAVHINCGLSRSVGANRRYGSSTSDPSNQSGGTVLIGLYTHFDTWQRGSIYCTSDRRAKKNIVEWNTDEAMNLLNDNVKPVWYNWNSDRDDSAPHLGYIAQDLLRAEVPSLIQEFENEDIKEADEEFKIPAGRQLVVDYQKLSIYLVEICKNQEKRISNLEKILNEYDIVTE
jgi:hypothetical protein